MLSFAVPIRTGPESPPSPTTPSSLHPPPIPSPSSARSRRIALLPSPPAPPAPPASPPVPARSPLRPIRRSSDAPVAPRDTALSKRKHALLELLTSERAYASDLALIRDIHMPLALGQQSPFLNSATAPAVAAPASPVPPMTREDVRIIFGNVEELAVFSEVFCEKLEDALSGVLDLDGDGQDRVAELFLSMIPLMKPPYTTYITRHPSAVAHLNALPQTPALAAYLGQTHTLAQSYTHAWDLPSLLIKPVQRLLKYPLLLSAIMDDTQPGEAKDKLRDARDKMEEVARGVNEGRRRWEVVKNLLDGKHPPPVRLKSVKGLRNRNGSKDDQGQIEGLEKRLNECKAFIRDFAKDVVDWTMALRDMISQLERWSITFGRVIGLGQPHGSEALNLFTDIVSTQISPIWISLETVIQTVLLPKLARLLATTAHPLLLLEHMRALRVQHLQLLDSPASKTRPANSLVDASQSYLALDAQLRAELPRYVEILERGLMSCLRQFADWQARFWKEVRAQWVELWDALGVEGDMTAGAADTIKVWRERWAEVDAIASRLGITRPRYERTVRTSGGQGPAAALATAFVAGATPAMSFSSSSSSPTTPMRPHSVHSLDLGDILNGVRGALNSPSHDYLPMSPSSYMSYGTGDGHSAKQGGSERSKMTGTPRGSSDRPEISRRESDRLPLAAKDGSARRVATRHNSERLPLRRDNVQRRGEDRASTPRQSLGDRPVMPRQGVAKEKTKKPGLLKKISLDFTTSTFSRGGGVGDLQQSPLPEPEPRLSVHTSSSSLVSGSASGSGSGASSTNRLSRQSLDVHIGMDMHAPAPGSGSGSGSGLGPVQLMQPPLQRSPSRTSQLGSKRRPYAFPMAASIGDLVAAVLPGGTTPPPPSSHTPATAVHGHSPSFSHPYGQSQHGDLASVSAPPLGKKVAGGSATPATLITVTTHEGGSQTETARGRDRVAKKPSLRKRFADAFRSPSKRPGAGRVSLGGTVAAVPEGTGLGPATTPELTHPEVERAEAEQELEGAVYPQTALYKCTVVHPFVLAGFGAEANGGGGGGAGTGTPSLVYRGLPFLVLRVGEMVEVLAEKGHPREHETLPVRPEDEDCEDCLLLARDEQGVVGWALASFLAIWS